MYSTLDYMDATTTGNSDLFYIPIDILLLATRKPNWFIFMSRYNFLQRLIHVKFYRIIILFIYVTLNFIY